MEKSVTRKLAMAAGSISAIAAPVAADAALVTVSTPIEIDLFDVLGGPPVFVGWDIDGNGGSEIELFGSATGFGGASEGTINSGQIALIGGTEGSAILGYRTAGTNPFSFPTSFYVTGGVDPLPVVYLPLATNVSGFLDPSTQLSYANFPNAPAGTYNILFAFANTDGLGIGWANWTLSPTKLTINEWSYEFTSDNTADAVFHIGEGFVNVPEPASTLPAIALLAAGAAGVRAWRKRKTG